VEEEKGVVVGTSKLSGEENLSQRALSVGRGRGLFTYRVETFRDEKEERTFF
jgi:hypothetical protein